MTLTIEIYVSMINQRSERVILGLTANDLFNAIDWLFPFSLQYFTGKQQLWDL